MEKYDIEKLRQIYENICENEFGYSDDQLRPLAPLLNLKIDAFVAMLETITGPTICKLIRLLIETCQKSTNDRLVYGLAVEFFEELGSTPMNNYFKQRFLRQNATERCTTLGKYIQKFSENQPSALWKEIIENNDVQLLEENPGLFLAENSEPKKIPDWLLRKIVVNEDSNNQIFDFLVDRGVVQKEQARELFWDIVDYIVQIDVDEIYDHYLSGPLGSANRILNDFGIEDVVELTKNQQNVVFGEALELNIPLVALFFLNNYELDKENINKRALALIDNIFDQEIEISDIESAESIYNQLFGKVLTMGASLEPRLNRYISQYGQLDPIFTKIFVNIQKPSKEQLSAILADVSKNKEKLIKNFGKTYYDLEDFLLSKIEEEELASKALVDFSAKVSLQSKLRSLALLHKRVCDKIAIGEIQNVVEPSRIRELFPNSNFEKLIGKEYAKNVGQLCSLLSAGIFCNDLENVFGFSLQQIKVIISSLYPENRIQFENTNSKSELCKLIAESMDKSVEEKFMIDPRVRNCRNKDKWGAFSPEQLDELDIIKIWPHDERMDCYSRRDLLETWEKDPKFNVVADWIENPFLNTLTPGQERYYALPDGNYIDQQSATLLKNRNLTSFDVKMSGKNGIIGTTDGSTRISDEKALGYPFWILTPREKSMKRIGDKNESLQKRRK